MGRGRLFAGVGLIAVLALTLAGVLVQSREPTGEPLDAPLGVPSPSPAEPTPSPSPSPSPTEQAIEIPYPDTTGRDFDRIFREIVAFLDWAYQHPSAHEALVRVYHPACDCFSDAQGSLEELAARGWHFDGAGIEILEVVVAQEFPSVARLEVRVNQPEQSIIDSEGVVVETAPSLGEAVFSFSLVRSGESWRIRTVTDIS